MKTKLSFIILGILLVLATMHFVSAEDGVEANYCCEKTTSGAWCQNAPESQCDANFKKSPTACDSTSYCKKGCCFNAQDGICMENTAQRVCDESGGTWGNDSQCNIPQCNLGCCILADQGAFVTLARCRAISGFYGIATDFRRNINNELSCIATAQGQDKGACVSEDSATFQKKCVFTTRANCPTGDLSLTISSNGTNQTASAGFYKDTLCTAEELGTNCSRSTKTMLLPGKDEIYYQDTCGQPANIYDASRYNDNQYWKKVYKKSESCGAGLSNANSKTCGNCDYYLGSIGKQATRSTGIPTSGDYICIDLSCKSVNKKHGESWCVKDSPSGNGQDPAGSRYFKEICLNGEVITEPCADFRQETCIEDTFNGYSEAACRVNRWQDCSKQVQQSDCENKDQRDCSWIEDYYFSSNTNQIEKTNNDTSKGPLTPTGLCVPFYPPGLVFWGSSTTTSSTSMGTSGSLGFPAGNGSVRPTSSLGTGYVSPTSAGTSAKSQCSLGNAQVTFKWIKTTRPADFFNLFGKEEDWKCDEETGNCQYLSDEDIKNAQISDDAVKSWSSDMNGICYQLGDCGGYINYVGKYTEDGFASYKDGKRVAGSGGSEILEQPKTTTTANTALGGQRPTATTADTVTSGLNAASGLANTFGGTGNIVKDLIREVFTGS
jgi:hypothetical protein